MPNLLGCIECRKEPDVHPETAKPLPHGALPISGTSYTISRGQHDVDQYMQTRERLLDQATAHLAGSRFPWIVEHMGKGAIVRPAEYAGKRLHWMQKGAAVQGHVVVLEDEGERLRKFLEEGDKYDRMREEQLKAQQSQSRA